MEDFSKRCGKFLGDVYQFEGRLSKKQYSTLFEKWFGVVACVLAPHFIKMWLFGTSNVDWLFIMIEMIFAIFAAVGLVGMIIRRLHDMNKTGFKILSPIIIWYLVNSWWVWLLYHLYLSVWEGTDGANKYGEKPTED